MIVEFVGERYRKKKKKNVGNIDKKVAPIFLALGIIFEVLLFGAILFKLIRLIPARTNIKFTRRLLLNIIAPAKINRINHGF